MESIQIRTGEICLSVNGDESRVIRFNPSDLLFAEKFYRMLGEAEKKTAEYQERATTLVKDAVKGADGLPVNMDEHIGFIRDMCSAMRQMIDDVFGQGTSQAAFGDVLDPDVFGQFFDGIMPYFETARAEKVAQYLKNPTVQKRSRARGGERSKK